MKTGKIILSHDQNIIRSHEIQPPDPEPLRQLI